MNSSAASDSAFKILALFVIAHAVDEYQHGLNAEKTTRKFERDTLKRNAELAKAFLFGPDAGEERTLSWWIRAGGFQGFITVERVRMLANSGRRLPAFTHGMQWVLSREHLENDPDFVEAVA